MSHEGIKPPAAAQGLAASCVIFPVIPGILKHNATDSEMVQIKVTLLPLPGGAGLHILQAKYVQAEASHPSYAPTRAGHTPYGP